MITLGIDPGASGAICSISDLYGVETIKLDSTEKDISLFIAYAKQSRDCFAYIERVHSFPGAGVAGMFNFGQSYGFLRGCLISLNVPFEELLPAKWQRSMQCLSKGNKNVTKARAQQLFPAIKCTHAISDAILIAEYGRRLRTGILG